MQKSRNGASSLKDPLAVLPQTAKSVSESTGAELRRTPRRPFKRPVGVMCRGHYHLLHARQLSEGGVLIRIGAPEKTRKYTGVNQFTYEEELVLSLDDFPEGQQVLVTFTLPSGFSLIARGQVIYHERDLSEESPQFGQGIGIKFDHSLMPLNHRRHIRNFVSSKLASETEEAT